VRLAIPEVIIAWALGVGLGCHVHVYDDLSKSSTMVVSIHWWRALFFWFFFVFGFWK